MTHRCFIDLRKIATIAYGCNSCGRMRGSGLQCCQGGVQDASPWRANPAVGPTLAHPHVSTTSPEHVLTQGEGSCSTCAQGNGQRGAGQQALGTGAEVSGLRGALQDLQSSIAQEAWRDQWQVHLCKLSASSIRSRTALTACSEERDQLQVRWAMVDVLAARAGAHSCFCV